MQRYLSHRVSIDGIDRTPAGVTMCMVEVDDNGLITVSPWDGIENHSTVFVNGCLQLKSVTVSHNLTIGTDVIKE